MMGSESRLIDKAVDLIDKQADIIALDREIIDDLWGLLSNYITIEERERLSVAKKMSVVAGKREEVKNI